MSGEGLLGEAGTESSVGTERTRLLAHLGHHLLARLRQLNRSGLGGCGSSLGVGEYLQPVVV